MAILSSVVPFRREFKNGERTRSRAAIVIGFLLSAMMVACDGKGSPSVQNDGATPRDPAAEPVGHGLRTFTVGNSFHYWLSYVLGGIAVDAGFKDHVNLGYSMIGGSQLIQHWNLPETNNPAKINIRDNQVDVLTMCGMYLPDEGIEKFVHFGLEHSPNMRFTLQEFWLPAEVYDPNLTLAKKGGKVDHNAFSGTELRRLHAPYFRDMDECVRDINRKIGKQVLFVVPTGQAILRLREMVIAGQVPGFKTQSDLFADATGHPYEPIEVLAGYCHYAVIYHRSPVGLPVPFMLKGTGNPQYDKSGLGLSSWFYATHPDPKSSGVATPEDVQLARRLQELAWDTVIHHPLSGMYVGGTSPAEAKEAEAARTAWLQNLRSYRGGPHKSVVDAVAYNTIVEKAADPDTRSGFALRARKDVAKPGWMTTGTFSTFECFGRYRMTFRIKCSDIAVTNTVCAIAVDGGVRGEGVHREIKGTDFTVAGKYQDFALEFLRSDVMGNFFFSLAYGGHADVSVDTITSERVGETTDRELVEKLGIGPKINARPLGKIAPKALWVQGQLQGPFHELDPFAPALRALKIPYQVAEVDIPGYKAYDFPADWEGLSQYSIVLLSDVNPRALNYMGRRLLRSWVEQGGTLLVTGGQCALGMGQTKGTVLEEIYPVQVTPWDLVDGGAFKSTRTQPEGCPPYRSRAGSYLIHRTTAKPDDQVVLTCNGHPLLACHKAGLGKVIVFTGTAIESDLKVKPFWDDPTWAEWSARFLQATLE